MAKQLRVHQLAKELGVPSKAIIAKCQAEDLAAITNHMSVVSAGLAASVREWFSEGEHGTTVETAEPVDLKKVRRKPRRKPAPAAGAVAVVEEPQAEPVESQAAEEAVPAETPTAAAAAPAVTEIESAELAPAVAAEQAPPVGEPVGTPVVAGPLPVGLTPPEAPPAAVPPEAVTGPVGQAPAVTAEPAKAKAKEAHRRAQPPRPQMVAPAPAQIQGPRVIRVERPEAVRPFRPGRSGYAPGAAAPAAGAPEVAPEAGKRAKVRGRETTADDEAEERRKAAKLKTKAKKAPGREGTEVVEHLREWRDRDLLERQERLAGATGRGLHARRATETRRPAAHPAAPVRKTKAQVREPIIIKDLCAAIGQTFNAVWQKLMNHGAMARISDALDAETAQLVSMELGVELEVVAQPSALERLEQQFARMERNHMERRPPVVTFLGHVDHGKTSLLDRIRNARVAEGEAGGITQHIGAYQLQREGRAVTFLDTPGHAAFTALRARGANMTDIVVLVVAADDGVMPQTVEAIHHARAASVPIVVALNKVDLPGIDYNRLYGQLAERGLMPAEWHGDTDVIKTSAITGEGVEQLVEHLYTLGELLDLKADPTVPAGGAAIETAMEEGTGPVASVLVRDGVLRVGDVVVCGTALGRVRAMIDDLGRRLAEVGPSTPVQIAGLDELPQPGEKFYVVESLQAAKEVAEERRRQVRAKHMAQTAKPVTLEELLQQRQAGELPELNVIVKADVLGSVEVLRNALGDLPSDKVRLRVLHGAVGGVSESDVLLADASKAVIVGFNVVPEPAAQRLAEQKGVTIRLYRVIYELMDALKRSLEGLLEPERRQETRGRAEVRAVFKVSKVGTVAGCYVTDGNIARNLKVRLVRDSIVIRHEASLESLRRFKDDVREVRQGMECGVKIAGFDDVKAGDVIEAYEIVEVARLL